MYLKGTAYTLPEVVFWRAYVKAVAEARLQFNSMDIKGGEGRQVETQESTKEIDAIYFLWGLPCFFLNWGHNFESFDHTSNAVKTRRAAIKITKQKHVVR